MSYYQQQYNDMGYYQPQVQEMSSYVAVQGAPRKDSCSVFGLTPKEVRYLRIKFNNIRRPSDTSLSPLQHPNHGVSIPASPVVVLNALGYIGFKVVSTCGDSEVYLWTVERNLDTDLDCQEASAVEHKTDKSKSKVEKGAGRRRHSLANFLHLK